MADVTRILDAAAAGDPKAAAELLPLVYEELRKLAAARMAAEAPAQTLQATALVHEAYLRLVDGEKVQRWDSRGHFFAAAAEAMRRILIEGQQPLWSLRAGDIHQLGLAGVAAAVLDPPLAAGGLDEEPPHRLGGGGKEMA